MVVFPTEQQPPRADKPHICADRQTIIFCTPIGNRIGWAEEGHAFGVAQAILAYMRRLDASAAKAVHESMRQGLVTELRRESG